MLITSFKELAEFLGTPSDLAGGLSQRVGFPVRERHYDDVLLAWDAAHATFEAAQVAAGRWAVFPGTPIDSEEEEFHDFFVELATPHPGLTTWA